MAIGRFGAIDGQEVHEVTLASNAGAVAKIITYGATVRDLVVPRAQGLQRVILGLDRVEDYAAHAPYMGAIVGRYGNRIGRGRFRLDGKTYRLDLNEKSRQHLHGGSKGFARRIWGILDHSPSSVTLGLVSQDGDMGYPGRCVATCAYSLLEPATLRLVLEATSDRPTPANLTTHLYFNLDQGGDILAHRLEIAAEHVTPTDEDLIPTGEVRSVADTPFDFRPPRAIGAARRQAGVEYDINFVLAGEPGVLSHAAILSSELSGVAMELWTTEPGLQFYGGHLLKVPVPGLGGTRYGRYGGLCLEPQRFPDGPNKRHFPPCILRPGEVSRQVSELRFANV
jgi:aldose 1-epimerase